MLRVSKFLAIAIWQKFFKKNTYKCHGAEILLPVLIKKECCH